MRDAVLPAQTHWLAGRVVPGANFTVFHVQEIFQAGLDCPQDPHNEMKEEGFLDEPGGAAIRTGLLAAKQAGWDFVEENVQTLFKGTEAEDRYDGRQKVAMSALPVAAANCLVPGSIKITGPAVEPAGLRGYMSNVLRRAGQAGCRTLVFGSGGARQVPDGWDRVHAYEQIVAFGKMAAPIAQRHGVTIAPHTPFGWYMEMIVIRVP